MITTLHPSTQLLERNLQLLKPNLLLVSPPEVATVNLVLSKLPKKKVYISCQTLDLHIELAEQNIPSEFQTHYAGKAQFAQAVVFLPKSDAEIHMTLLWVSQALTPTGELILIGQNDAGIKSAKKVLASLIGPITQTDTARHSALYLAQRTLSLPHFDLAEFGKTFPVSFPALKPHLPSTPATIYSLPGVFSHGKLDDGTKLLLESFRTEPLLGQKILDWGCGAGSLGATLALAHPNLTVDLADNSALALAATRKTLELNGLSNCRVIASNGFSGLEDKYDAILTNPPFHRGHDTHYLATENFLRECSQHLHEQGRLRLVANIFLRYEPLLERYFGYVKTITQTKKYKILEAVKTNSGNSTKKHPKPKRSKRPQVGYSKDDAGLEEFMD
jgi:16S rRNA (guanine1207-N2)-methyltransferase